MSHALVWLTLFTLASCGAEAGPGSSAPRSPERTSPAPISPAPSSPEPATSARPTASPRSTPNAGPSSAREVFSVPALDAVLRGHRLIVVDPGAQVVRALNVGDGSELWRVELGSEAGAAVIHTLRRGRLMVQVPGQHFHTITVEHGRLIARRESPRGWRFVHRRGGACGLMSECTLAPISCDDGAALGPELRGATVSYAPLGRGDDGRPTCASPLEVLGHARDLSLYVVRTRENTTAEVIALDPAGAVRWRSEAHGCNSCLPLGVGSAPDGSVCWTSQRVGAPDVARYQLHAFRCSDGEALFTRTFPVRQPYRSPPLITGWVEDPPGLYALTEERAVLINPDGSERWSRTASPTVFVQPTNLSVPSYPLALDRFETLEFVDSRTGAMTARRALGEDELRAGHEALGVARRGQGYERSGESISAPQVFSFERSRQGSQLSIDGQPVLELPGDGRMVGEHLSPESTHVVVAELRPDEPELLRIFERREPDCAPSCCPPQLRTPGPDGTVECCRCESP